MIFLASRETSGFKRYPFGNGLLRIRASRRGCGVLAGDIHIGRGGVSWIRKRFGGKPVIYVAGNHEFYGNSVPALLNELHSVAEGSNICVREKRFLGQKPSPYTGGCTSGCLT
jgi:hypothetical protein